MAESAVNSSSLRILQVLHDFPPHSIGGTEGYAVRSALELRARGHEVFVACGQRDAAEKPGIRQEEIEGIPVLRIQRANLLLDHWDKSHAPEVEVLFRELLRELQPDVVHVHHWLRLTRTLVGCSHEAGIPAFVTLHDLWSSCPRSFRVRDESFCAREMGPASCRDCVSIPAFYEAEEVDAELVRFREDLQVELRTARRVIVPSAAHRDTVARFTSLPEDRMVVLPHGSLTESLAPARPSPPADGLVRIGHWGHLSATKGVHLILEAARRLPSADRGRLEIHLWGECSDAAYDARLRELSRGLRVVRHGGYEAEGLGGVMLDWAIIPSLASESWSFVLDEAFALGLPVIASDRGALGERVGDAGLCFEAEDAGALAGCLERVLEDPELGAEARRHLPPLRGMGAHVDSLIALYRQGLGDKTPLETTPAEVVGRRNAWSARRLEMRYRQLLVVQNRLRGEHERVAHLEDQVAAASASVADAKRSVRDHSLSIALHRDELSKRERELASLRHHAEAVERERDEVREVRVREHEEAERSLAEARARLEGLVAEHEAASGQLRSVRGELQELQRSAEENRERLSEALERSTSAERKAEEIAGERDRVRQRLGGVEGELVESTAGVESLRRREGELERRLGSVETELADARRERDRAARLAEELADERRALAAKVEPLEVESERLQRELASYRAEIPELRAGLAERDALRARADALAEEIAAARERLASLEGSEERAGRAEEELGSMRRTLETLEGALGPDAVRGDEEFGRWGELLARAVAGMRLQMEELADELERVRSERDAHLSAREGAEARLAMSDETLERLDGKWWAPVLGVGKEREAIRRSGGSLRILLVIHQFLPRHAAGSEVYTYNLAKELSKRHEVELLFTEAHYGVPQYRVRRGVYDGLPFTEVVHQHAIQSFPRSYEDPRMEAIFERVLERFRPDVVHLNHLHYFSIGCIDVVKKRDIPLLYTLHEYMLLCPRFGRMRREDGTRCETPEAEKCGECIRHQVLDPAVDDGLQPRLWQRAARFVPPEARRFLKSLLPPPEPAPIPEEIALDAHIEAAGVRLEKVRKALRKVDLLVAPSRFLRGRFLAAGVTEEDRIVYSDYGMDPERFHGIERTPSDSLRIGFIGSIAEFKGVHVLVDAMNLLAEREELVCHVYGKLEHFPDYAEELRQRIENPRIELKGAYDNRDVGRVLGALDVLVVPSLWYENSPLTIHEAWLAGLPVVTSRLGGMAELVEHGRSGLLFDPGDAQQLAEQLFRLADDPGLRARLSDCHRLVKTIEDDARDMESHYRRLLAEETPK